MIVHAGEPTPRGKSAAETLAIRSREIYLVARVTWEVWTKRCFGAGKALPSALWNFSRTSTSHQRVGGRVLAP